MTICPKDPSYPKDRIPPPFGTHFNSNPLENHPSPQTPIFNPNNDPDEIKHEHYSEAAQEKPRDENGRFIKDGDDNVQTPTITTSTPPSQTTPNPSNPLPITITENTKYSEKKDPPLFNVSVIFTNPVTYLKNFLSRFLKNQDIDLRLKIKPFATIGLVIAFGMVGGTAFTLGRYIFPNSSPVFHRQVVYPGIIQKGESGGYTLLTQDANIWKLKPQHNNINLSSLENKQVVVTGRLTSEAYLIEVSELIIAENPSQALIPTQTTPTAPSFSNIPNQDLLPKLYSGIIWETNQKKILTFTSGKRRIEQEGVYLESSLVTEIPQDFINYYTTQLTNLSFKQTLNSSDPNGTTITYSKDDLFLTFGTKNVFSGSGDNKKLTGYKTFIEHN